MHQMYIGVVPRPTLGRTGQQTFGIPIFISLGRDFLMEFSYSLSIEELCLCIVQASLCRLHASRHTSLIKRHPIPNHTRNRTSSQESKRVASTIIPSKYILSLRTRYFPDMRSSVRSDTLNYESLANNDSLYDLFTHYPSKHSPSSHHYHPIPGNFVA